ncbi:MAG TPA: bifunctional transaldolase/phosoglucose isomerase [Thermoanaerobaculia bacterium]|nr:bifunctional transaldolase/phosoglucose isomerase [Thermoanaerobaculia bacterium]
MTNPLAQLPKAGQSVWFDQMERRLVTSGRLQQMIDEDDLRGLTSNPTIFEKAIGGSDDYDGQLRMLASQGMTRDEIYDELVVEDITNAADVFAPVYQKTQDEDGYVSLEVSPLMAGDTAKTVSEAKRLFTKVGRPNLMIKIPATPEGIPAIEQAIALGININVTLIFSNDVYAQVIEAYLRGLEKRVSNSLPIGHIASVASFFVSRIDAQADKQMEAKGETELMGKVAIANAKMAYQLFKQVFTSERFEKLRAKGARVQRPLWASTGTKNPKYSDVLYIESLIGADTVNTIPPATYDAFKDHGSVQLTLEQDVDEARRVLEQFEAKGFSLKAITEKLTADGVKSFNESFAQLVDTIEARRDAVVRGLPERVMLHNVNVDDAIARVEKEKVVSRIWAKDSALWKSDDAHRKIIDNALGWLVVAQQMAGGAKDLMDFADHARRDYDYVVVLGMGGSSLCSEVVRRLFGKREGYPELLVLDSTVPEAVQMLEAKIDLQRTLFIVASKSGTTTEPMMFHRYFYDRVKNGKNFLAVTDPDTQLVKDAQADQFRSIFINPADIGGRYSALSFFGLLPMALSGVDVAELLDRAVHAMHVSVVPQVRKNPAALLGAVIGGCALQGRDKLTVIAPRPLDTLGLWVEQLVAESTGKEGKGIVPIAGEPALAASEYGNDRLFVSVRLRGSDDTSRLRELAAAGHPVVDIVLEDALDLGEIFFTFEFATAVAGYLIGVNPFDQPNVQESKDKTKELLTEFSEKGTMTGAGGPPGKRVPVSDADAIANLLASVKPGDYVALTQYFGETIARDEKLAAIRETIAKELHVATTSGYGPRFLHSTGQLHKGGGGNGVFLQLSGGKGDDVAIPNEKFGFGALVRAQAIGDFLSLLKRDRRALSIDLGNDVDAGLDQLAQAVKNAVVKAKVVN